MSTHPPAGPPARPMLRAEDVLLRPGRAEDVDRLAQILAEPEVRRWWGDPEPAEEILVRLLDDDQPCRLVVEVDGRVAGGIEYYEENTPDYRHAGIDIFLSEAICGRGIGERAVRLLARFLLDDRGHHRLTIDPAASNARAIRCYQKVGFKPVGRMRQYERGPDGTYHDGLLMDLLAPDLGRGPAARRRLAADASEGTPMQFGRYYEEFEVGATYRHWPGKTVTEYDNHLFCLLTMNHHPLHLDAHYAQTSTDFGRNVVVGNYVYSLLLGMSVADVSGKAIANLEVESLRHVAPTFHGDTLYGESTVLDRIESGSKPDRGIVAVETKGYNQDGTLVCVFRRKVMVPKRSYGQARGGDQPGRPTPREA